MSQFVDINGKIIGDWIVLNKEPSKNGKTYWKVQCRCGVEKILPSQNIKKGKGCWKCAVKKRVKIKVDDIIGKWTVIESVEPRNGTRWLCRCDCGKEYIIPSKTLGSKKSIGCFECGRFKLRRFFGPIPKWIITQTKMSAKNRRLEFNLSIEYLAKVFEEQKGLCPLTGLSLKFSTAPKKVEDTTASPDRIDNTKGYIEGNVRFVHKVINIMRKSMSDEEFLYWCQLVVNHFDKTKSND